MDGSKKERIRDLRLVRRMAAGDRRALELFYASYADLLFAYICHRMNGARADSEDVWQNTLLSMLDALSSFSGESRLFTWICGIARHKIADHYRRVDRTEHTASEVIHNQMAEIAWNEPLPDELLLKNATRAVVIETLAALPDRYRIALTARYADGKSIPEVAKMLHRSYKATESLLSRARSAFRTTFIELEGRENGE